jgi:ureidoglycolate lyase
VQLVPEPLTFHAFAPFGRLLDGRAAPGRPVNQDRGTRCDLASFDGQPGRVTLSRYDLRASELPLEVAVLERHRASDQAFFSLCGAEALVVVTGAAPDGSPDPAAARAFISGPATPFLYSAGTWHAPLFALGRDGAFLMVMRETGTPADTEIVELPAGLRVMRGSWDTGIAGY